jgi:hypothetical protein
MPALERLEHQVTAFEVALLMPLLEFLQLQVTGCTRIKNCQIVDQPLDHQRNPSDHSKKLIIDRSKGCHQSQQKLIFSQSKAVSTSQVVGIRAKVNH